MATHPHDLREHVALAEVLDRVLAKGAVIAGEVVISVADVDLVRLQLQVVLGSAGVFPLQEEAARKAVGR